MMVQIVLVFQLFSAPTDRTRAAETAEMALKQRIQEQERDAAAREALRRRFFEQKFNRLVDAVTEFAKEYNGGKGNVWPQREADRLRKAMLELQSLEAALGAKNEQSPACRTPTSR